MSRVPSPPKLRLVDLFAGCGGISQGFRRTGRFESVGAVEKDKFAAATYAANFGESHIHLGDIVEWVKSGELPDADVVAGGPPCQGFSLLGKRQSDDPINSLWSSYVDALDKIKPKAFVMENVERFIKTPQYQQLKAEFDGGRLKDYRFDSGVLLASDFGSFQARRRAIVIGTRKDVEKIHLPASSVLASDWPTVSDAFAGSCDENMSPIEPRIAPGHTELPDGQTFHAFGVDFKGPYKTLDLHVTRKYTDLSMRRFEQIPYGGNRFDLDLDLQSPCWRRHQSGSGDVMGRLRWERPSVTVRTEFWKPEKGRYLHPTEHRALSLLEGARLQGFPDDFLWCGPKAEIGRQIGNAVPVQLAHALARHVAEALSR
ncbi:DNA cytosine methyltransferase [Streptomyces sp. NPDC003674]